MPVLFCFWRENRLPCKKSQVFLPVSGQTLINGTILALCNNHQATDTDGLEDPGDPASMEWSQCLDEQQEAAGRISGLVQGRLSCVEG